MSDKHEQYIHSVIGGRRTRNSGAVWSDQTDVRNDLRNDTFAFAADGKATFNQSISIKREDWAKLVEQAQGLIPTMPIRFYDTWRLDVGLDLWLIDGPTMETFLEIARENG